MPRKIFKLLTKADIGLLLFLILVILFSFYLSLKSKTGNFDYAECRIKGKSVQKIDLQKDQIVELKNGLVLEVKDKRIRVLKSDCPKQICVKQGWIKTTNDLLVCIPNRTIIFLKKEADEDGDVDYISQ